MKRRVSASVESEGHLMRSRRDRGDEVRLADLPAEFRERAATLRGDGGAEQPAIAWERAAQCVEEALTGYLDERLSLADAETESGYTRRHLRRLIRDGTLPEEPDGTIQRRHLPTKPGTGVASDLSPALSSRVQLARAVADGD